MNMLSLLPFKVGIFPAICSIAEDHEMVLLLFACESPVIATTNHKDATTVPCESFSWALPQEMAGPQAAAPRRFRRTIVRKITYCTRNATTLAPMAPTAMNQAQTLNGSVSAMTRFSAPRVNMSAAHA